MSNKIIMYVYDIYCYQIIYALYMRYNLTFDNRYKLRIKHLFKK